MKDHKNDSTEVLARFGRDRRPRTAAHAAERVERRPRLQRDAADSEQEPRSRRASYNPNFTRDNRPAFDEKPRRTSGGERPFRGGRPQAETDKPRFGTKGRTGAAYDGQSDSKPFGERGPKRFGAKPGAKGGFKKFGDKADSKFGPKKPGFRKDKPGFRKQDDKPRSYPKYDPAKQSGICSRREADDFITAGLVSVNGQIVTELGSKVMPSDEVRFNDSRVEGEKKVYLVLNKPKGYVTSLDDPHAGKLVMDLVAGACTERIYPVGRLDKNSLGLLLFTNDGDLTKQLTHPSYRKKKIYQVTLDKPLTRADMDRIAEGVTLEDGEIFADEISYVKENKQEVGIEIHSGRNRIVRRIFEFLGYTVTKLDRVYYAGLTKKNLKRGAWRFLTREEVERLKSGRYE